MTERVQKILSQWGIASRRQAEKMILAGRVSLNGKVVKLGDKANLKVDRLEVDGRKIKPLNRPDLVYILLNKPAGVVSTCNDPQNRTTVLDLLPATLKEGQGIHPVGRLDLNSSGALLLTNDGDLTLTLTHPRYHLPKTYLVWIDGHPTDAELNLWRRGIYLSGRKTLPAQVRVVNTAIRDGEETSPSLAVKQNAENTLLEIIITEGRNRQIRRIAEQLGYQVLKLHRTAIGEISLQLPKQPMLLPGSYRYLQNKEVAFLKKTIDSNSNNLAAPKQERSS
ncbi:MAG: pseudouridine synthase [Stanieria sp.]